MTPEGKVKAKVKTLLKQHGVWYFMPVPWGNRGIPDLACVLKGQALFIETKAGRGKVTPLQARCMEEIRQAGGIAVVINENNLNQLHDLLHQLGAEG